MSRRASWCALAVLAGLLAMHGLGDHGAMGGHEMSSRSSATAPVVAPPHPGHSMPDMVMCLALLGLGLVLALRLQRALRFRRTPRPRLPLLVVATRARDPDPPELERLSIWRC